jgi:hypothetical protein
MKESVMLRVIKSLIVSGVVVCGGVLAGVTQAEAGDWGFYYGPASRSYGYGLVPYGGGYGNYGNGYGYPAGMYGRYNLYNNGYGYQTYYTPGSNFRGGPAFSAYPHLNCR